MSLSAPATSILDDLSKKTHPPPKKNQISTTESKIQI